MTAPQPTGHSDEAPVDLSAGVSFALPWDPYEVLTDLYLRGHLNPSQFPSFVRMTRLEWEIRSDLAIHQLSFGIHGDGFVITFVIPDHRGPSLREFIRAVMGDHCEYLSITRDTVDTPFSGGWMAMPTGPTTFEFTTRVSEFSRFSDAEVDEVIAVVRRLAEERRRHNAEQIAERQRRAEEELQRAQEAENRSWETLGEFLTEEQRASMALGYVPVRGSLGTLYHVEVDGDAEGNVWWIDETTGKHGGALCGAPNQYVHVPGERGNRKLPLADLFLGQIFQLAADEMSYLTSANLYRGYWPPPLERRNEARRAREAREHGMIHPRHLVGVVQAAARYRGVEFDLRGDTVTVGEIQDAIARLDTAVPGTHDTAVRNGVTVRLASDGPWASVDSVHWVRVREPAAGVTWSRELDAT